MNFKGAFEILTIVLGLLGKSNEMEMDTKSGKKLNNWKQNSFQQMNWRQ